MNDDEDIRPLGTDRERELIQRIRNQERDKAQRTALVEGLASLRTTAAANHAEVLSRLDRNVAVIQDHEGRLRACEARAVLSDKLAARINAEKWGDDDWAELLPMVRERKERGHGRGRWKERITVIALIATCLAVLFQAYTTLQGGR